MFAIGSLVRDAISKLSNSSTGLDDAVDRLNYVITVFMLGVFCVIIGSKQHFGKPIQCMTPAEFRSGWNQYVEDYCFIQSTYTYPMNNSLTYKPNRPIPQYVNYYQWVPYMFMAQAMCFFMPNFIWQALQAQNGMDLETIIVEATKLRSVLSKKRQEGAANLTAYIEDCLRNPSRNGKVKGSSFCDRLDIFSSGSTSRMYFLIKTLYLINVVVQFFLINKVIGDSYTFWGWQVLNDLLAGRSQVDSGLFPRDAMCDFLKQEIGNVQSFSVQCVLMINMLNEKLFLLLWFWFLFVALCCLVSLVQLFVTLVPCYFRERRALHYLKGIGEGKDNFSGVELRRFVYVGLGMDGLLLLRFIEHHAGVLVARDQAARLWHWYRQPIKRNIDLCMDKVVKSADNFNHEYVKYLDDE